MPPRISKVLQDDTHRLIPSKYIDQDESVLTRLTDDDNDLSALFELESATNDRLLGEAGALPGISVRELVFGVPNFHVINAAFTHANPLGGRFNAADRGGWYAGFRRETSEIEMAYHRGNELQEIAWKEKETFSYVDFLADFRGQFHDIRNDGRFRDCLSPDSYKASQRLGRQLLEDGSPGVVYPSVRHRGGTCLVSFRPALVTNVRKGASVSIVFENANAEPEFRRTR